MDAATTINNTMLKYLEIRHPSTCITYLLQVLVILSVATSGGNSVASRDLHVKLCVVAKVKDVPC